MDKEQIDALEKEHAISKGIDVMVLNIKRELKVRFGVTLTPAEMRKVIQKLVEARVG